MGYFSNLEIEVLELASSSSSKANLVETISTQLNVNPALVQEILENEYDDSDQ